MIFKRSLMLALLVALLFPAFSRAQDTSSDEVFELGEVVVTAPEASSEKIGAITTITAEEIKDAGYRTLDEALTMVPGLHVRTAGRGIPRVDFRGLRTRQLIVLLNGVPVASPWDNQFDPSFIPVENIAKIKVTRGPASVLYGSGGNSGIINIITKKAPSGVHGSVNAEAGQNDEYLGRATFSEGGEELNLFASGSYLTRGNFPLPDSFEDTELEEAGTRTNSDRRQSNVFANLMYTPDRDTTLALTLDLKQTEYGIPPDTVDDKFTNKNPGKLKKLKYRRVDDKTGASGQLSFARNFDNPISMRGWTYFSTLDEKPNEYKSIAFERLKTAEDRDTQRFGATVQTSLDLFRLGSATLALQGERGDVDSTVRKFKKNKAKTSLTKEHTYTYSGSLEYRVNPVDQLGIVLGAGSHWQERSKGDNEDDYSWLAGAHYDLPTHTRLKASVARKIRFPSLRRLYEDKKGNPDLNAENTRHYQAGVEQRISGWATTLDLVVFRINAEDFLEKDERTGKFVNFEEYEFQGVEASLINRSIESLVLQASYTYLDAENESSDFPVDTLEHRPENKVTLQATYSFLERYKAHLDYLWVDERDHFTKTLPIEVGTLDDYQVVDVKLSGTFLDGSTNLYLGARNLFDEEYAESYSLIMPGRRVYAGVEYRF
jgi:outer membrane receptor for ferrienterochelin and colicin